MSRRGRRLAFSMSILGGAVLLVMVLVFGSAVLEERCLRDLATYDEARSRESAEWLGRNGSRRAMQRLFDLSRELARRPDVENLSSGACNSMVRIGQALERIAFERRREVVPLLVTILRERPAYYTGQSNQNRIAAANCLRTIGPDAYEALPALQEALEDEDEGFRTYVVRAMDGIRGS